MLRKLISKNPLMTKFYSFQVLYQFSISIVVPFFSIILLSANWSTQQITYFFAISSFVVFLIAPIIGRVADEIGKKSIIYLGLILQIITFNLFYFFLENITFIYFIRIFDTISFICIGIVFFGAFEDYIKEKRGFWTGLFLGIGTIGTLIGPIIAGFIIDIYSAKFLFLISIFLVFFAILVLSILPKMEGNHKKISKTDLNPLSEIKHFLINKKLRGMALLGILMNSKGQIFSIFFPIFVIETLNLPVSYIGFFLSLSAFFHLFQFYFGRISDTISAEFGVMLGVFFAAGSIFMLPYVSGLYSLIILLIFYGIGSSIWNVNAWSLMTNIAKKNNMESEIIGTYSSVSKLGVFFSTIISSILVASFGIAGTLQFFSILILIGIVISYFFFEPIFHHENKKSFFHKII